MARSATFTTYVNAQLDPGLEQAYARQASIATSSYATITQAAEEATRATAGLLGGKGTTGAGMAPKIDAQVRSTKAVTTASADAERATAKLSSATTRQGVATTAAVRNNEALARSLNTTSLALNVVEGRLSPVAGRLSTVAKAASTLAGTQLGLVGFAAALFAVGRVANEYTNLSTRLRPFFDTQSQANQALNDVARIANRSRSALEPVGELYASLTSRAKDFGISQAQIARATEVASKATTLSGGSAEARRGALVQFSQAVGANFRGSGQEFQSLAEGAPQLLAAIAKGFKNVDGSIGTTTTNLRKFASDGKLSTQQVLDALDRVAPTLERQFQTLPATLSSASTKFANAITIMIGQFDSSVGFTSNLANGLTAVADNLRVIVALAAGVATAFAATKVGGLVSGLSSTIGGIIATQAQLKALDAAWVEDAAVSARALRTQAGLLELERNQIRLNIVEITKEAEARQAAAQAAIVAQREVALAAATTVDATRKTGFSISSTPGASLSARQAEAALEAEVAQIYKLEAEAANVAAASKLKLAGANQALAATNTELAATAGAAAAAEETLSVVTATTSGRVGAFRGALSSAVSFLGGPWGIAIGVAVTALYLFNSATSAADKSMQDLRFSQQDVADRFHKIAQAANTATASTKDFARAQILQSVGEKRRDVLNNYNDVRLRVGAAASRASGSFDGRASSEISAAVDRIRPTTSVGDINNLIQGLAKKYPKYFRDRGTVEKLIPGGADSSAASITNALAIADTARARFNVEATSARADLQQLKQPPVKPSAPVVAKTPAQIRAAAAQQAAQTPLQQARADQRALNAQLDSKTGLLPGKNDVETQNELAAAMQRVTAAQAAQTAGRAAASSGRAAERKAARDAIQDAKDEAKSREDASLLALEKKKPTLSQDEYLSQRLSILKTYDDEMARIDSSAARSHSAAEQQIADVKRIQAEGAKNGQSRDNILGKYSGEEKPTIAADRARDKIQDLVGTYVDGAAFIDKTAAQIADISKINPLGTGIYTQAQADADVRRINEGVRKPLTDLQRDYDRGVEIAKLQLAGRDAEASALAERNRLLDAGVEISATEFRGLQANYNEQLRINDALDARGRITSSIRNVLDDTRAGFTQLIVDLPSKGGAAGLDFIKSFQRNVLQVSAQQITEKLFAGSDEKLRALISGKSAVDQKIDTFAGSIGKVASSTDQVQSNFDRVATAAETLASRLDAVQLGGGVTGGGTPTLNSLLAQGNGVADRGLISLLMQGNGVTGPNMASNDNTSVITGKRKMPAEPFSYSVGGSPTGTAVASLVSRSLLGGLDKIVDKISGRKTSTLADGTTVGGTTFFGKLGDSVGAAVAGAGKGALASGIVSALGVQQNQTGAAAGGALGGLLNSIKPITAALGPFGSALAPVLGIVGGFVGNLFNKPKSGNASVSLNQYGQAAGGVGTGNAGSARTAATGAAKSVADGINQIVGQLGATITNLPALTIGSFNGMARVATTNTTKSLNANNFDSNTLKNFGKDGDAAAIQYAIEYSIQKGVIDGISAASKKILSSGQDMTQALNKATVIESIPKRLLQLTNPVKYAVQNLNDEFTKMISYLQEGGATAQQFADAQKLYDLSRAEAVKTATAQASDALKQFLADMVSSSASPLNKKTTFENASAELDKFRGDINAGKAVDQNQLITAAKNFQDASQALNGSDSKFFDDFDALRALLTKAAANIDGAAVASASSAGTDLPASPFASSAVQAALGNLASQSTAATQAQTTALSAKLDQLIGAVNDNAVGGSYERASSLRLLPGFYK